MELALSVLVGLGIALLASVPALLSLWRSGAPDRSLRRARRTASAEGWEVGRPDLLSFLTDLDESVAPDDSAPLGVTRWVATPPAGSGPVDAIARVDLASERLGAPLDRCVVVGRLPHSVGPLLMVTTGPEPWTALAPTLLPTSSPRYSVEHWHEVDLPAELSAVLVSLPLLSLQVNEDRWCATFPGSDDVPALLSRGLQLAERLAVVHTPTAHLGSSVYPVEDAARELSS